MKRESKNSGSVLLLAIFVVAFLAAVTMGLAQINTEEIQIVRNQIYAAQALAIAEAGLNDAFAQLRQDSSWSSGFTDKTFAGGSYTVAITGTLPDLTVACTGTSAQGFVAKVGADVTLSAGSPYIIRIDSLRINEDES
jgi:Tfp pilus assembly protein PilX